MQERNNATFGVRRVYEIELPWPPTANTYWRMWQGRMLLSERGRRYKTTVCGLVLASRCQRMEGRLSVSLMLYPPDRRDRDIDNCVKPVFDALQEAGAFVNDSQIDKLTVTRLQVRRGGRAIVRIDSLDGQ